MPRHSALEWSFFRVQLHMATKKWLEIRLCFRRSSKQRKGSSKWKGLSSPQSQPGGAHPSDSLHTYQRICGSLLLVVAVCSHVHRNFIGPYFMIDSERLWVAGHLQHRNRTHESQRAAGTPTVKWIDSIPWKVKPQKQTTNDAAPPPKPHSLSLSATKIPERGN